MSISRVLNRWLNRIYKSIAMLLVIFAVTISALRLLLPYAHNYREDFQNYINTTYNSNIIIGAISMGWQKQGPSLIAQNVSLLQTGVADVYIKEIALQVDFWRSIKNRQIVTHDITLAGAKILFDKSMLADNNNSKDESELIENISELFLDQIARFTVKNSQIIYRTQQQTHTFLVSQLRWLNEGDRHRANGSVIIDGLTSNNLQLQLDVAGDELKDMSGQLYLEANQLNITPWLGKVFVIENDKTHSEINFNAWLKIEEGLAQSLQLSLGNNAVSFLYNDEMQNVTIDAGQVLVNNLSKSNRQTLTSTPITISTNNYIWQPLTIEASQSETHQYLYLSSLDLTGLTYLTPLFSADESTRELIAELAPKGIVEKINLQKNQGGVQATASFYDVSTEFSQGIPGIKHVDGELVFSDKQVQINVLATNGALDFDKHFIKPIPYNDLSATLNAVNNDNGWQYNIDDIELISNELTASANVGISAPNDGEVSMALLASINDGDATFAQHYYPHLLMGDDLVNYLNGAIVSGKIKQAQVLFNGPLASFPFEDNSGIFVVDAELTDSEFAFDSDWSSITNFNANLNFTNNSMLITGRSGSLDGIDVTGVEAGIAELNNEQVLTVDAEFTQTNPEDIALLMNNSPMADSVGATLEQLVVTKPISGYFALNLPLNDVDNVVASGQVNFENNDVNLQAPAMQFSQVNGQLSFKNDVIRTKNLSLNWRELPLSLTVNARNNQEYYATNIGINAKWQEQDWLKQVPNSLKKYAHGTLPWQGQLSLYMHHDQNFYYDLSLASTLDSVELKLPEPYKLAGTEEESLSIKVNGQKNQSTINANLGDELSFYGVLDHEQVQFSRSHLVLGNEQMLLPIEGFHITTRLVNADFSQWQPFVFDIIDSIDSLENSSDKNALVQSTSTLSAYATNNQTPPLISTPERIRGSIASLDMFGHTLHDVSFNLHDKQSWWLLHLNAKEARSQIKFYPDWYQQGVDIDADFIHLSPVVSDGELVDTNTELEVLTVLDNKKLFTNFPPMRVQCGSCRYGNIDLGEVSFSVDKDETERLTLNKFQAKRGKTQVNFDAQWYYNDYASQTDIEGSLRAKDVEQEIERFGYPSTVRDSGVTSSYKLNWKGGPHEFSFANLNGNISGKLDDGYLAEVPDNAKAFSILSLQSLVRKLTFDFRDIFSDGMFYSEIKGDFEVQDGILYTKNTEMKGSAGDLSIQGNTNLADGFLDLRMAYTPNITSSLPAIAWIATLNPVVFLAGVALDEVIISKVVSELNFEVTGTIDEPKMVEVNRKNRNISVGASSPPQIVDNVLEENEHPLIKSIGTKPVDVLPTDTQKELTPLNHFDG